MIANSTKQAQMEAIQSPLALNLARETRNAVATDEFVDETLRREQGLAEIQAFLASNKRMGAQEANEGMIIAALQNNATPSLIEVMRISAGIPESRLMELKKQFAASATSSSK